MTHLTFTKRKLEKNVLKEIQGECVVWEGGSGHSVPKHVIPALVVGATYYLELYKFNDIGGLMQDDGLYLFHRSDDYFILKRSQYLIEAAARREKMYLENHEDWNQRTQALPERYRNRLNRFLSEDKDDEFRKEPMGWGYELTICELAVLYTEHGFGESFNTEPPEIQDYARKHGTSGNQHETAKAWAKHSDVAI